jgi:hypothetical protein
VNRYYSLAGRLRSIGCSREAADVLDVLNPDVAECAHALRLIAIEAVALPEGWQAEMGGYGSVSLKRPGGAWTSIRHRELRWHCSDGSMHSDFASALAAATAPDRSAT